MTHYLGNGESGSGSDEQWFELFRGGDRRGMDAAFETYFRKLVFYAARIIKDPRIAEELGSGALQKAWEIRRSYESLQHLNNSLYFILRNDCISLLRARTVESRGLSGFMQLQSDEFDVNKAVEPERVRAETLSRVWKEIDRQLDKQSADMLKLRFMAGLSDAEIARLYQIREAAVRGNRFRALEKLRKLFGNERFCLLIILFTNKLR